MTVDNDILLTLTQTNRLGPSEMHVGGKIYNLKSISLAYSEIPVTKPTTRGGVYFSDKMAFKIKATTLDVGIAKTLSKAMLGPNQDFEQIQIVTKVRLDSNEKELVMTANLISYVQKSSILELNLIVVDTKLAN